MKKVKQDIIKRLSNADSTNRLGLSLKVEGASVVTQLKKNKVNGRLTKMDALEAISKELGGLPVEDILEDAPATISERAGG